MFFFNLGGIQNWFLFFPKTGVERWHWQNGDPAAEVQTYPRGWYPNYCWCTYSCGLCQSRWCIGDSSWNSGFVLARCCKGARVAQDLARLRQKMGHRLNIDSHSVDSHTCPGSVCCTRTIWSSFWCPASVWKLVGRDVSRGTHQHGCFDSNVWTRCSYIHSYFNLDSYCGWRAKTFLGWQWNCHVQHWWADLDETFMQAMGLSKYALFFQPPSLDKPTSENSTIICIQTNPLHLCRKTRTRATSSCCKMIWSYVS